MGETMNLMGNGKTGAWDEGLAGIDIRAMFSDKQEMDMYQDMLRQYCLALPEHGYGMKRRELKQKDIVDLTSMLPGHAKDDDNGLYYYPMLKSKAYLDYLRSLSEDAILCNAIPCFQDMVLRVNKNRYIHCVTKAINLDAKTVTLWLHDYTAQSGVWSPGTSGTIDYRFYDGNRKVQTSTHDNQMTYAKIYGIIEPETMGWTPSQTALWEHIMENYCKRFENSLAKKGTSPLLELEQFTMASIAMTNYMLNGNKPKIERQPKRKGNGGRPQARKAENENVTPPERRIRYVGTIKVTSSKIPRKPTTESLRKYKVATWKARGGIRHMKDGRVIPFSESIRHRKCLMEKETETTPLPTTIKLKETKVPKGGNP